MWWTTFLYFLPMLIGLIGAVIVVNTQNKTTRGDLFACLAIFVPVFNFIIAIAIIVALCESEEVKDWFNTPVIDRTKKEEK